MEAEVRANQHYDSNTGNTSAYYEDRSNNMNSVVHNITGGHQSNYEANSHISSNTNSENYKMVLNELSMIIPQMQRPTYDTVEETFDRKTNSRIFRSTISIGPSEALKLHEKLVGYGYGSSKKQAENMAADK